MTFSQVKETIFDIRRLSKNASKIRTLEDSAGKAENYLLSKKLQCTYEPPLSRRGEAG